MRCALLLAALGMPVVTVAQIAAAGAVQVDTTDGDDAFINIEECAGIGPTGGLSLKWNVTLETDQAAVTGGEFIVFTSNATPTQGTNAPRYCQDHAPTANPAVYKVEVGREAATVNQTTGTADELPTSSFVPVPPFVCTEGTGDQTVHVCVEYHPTSTGGRKGGAIGQLKVSLTRPPAPTGTLVVTPGDGALNLTWSAVNDSAVKSYLLIAKQGGSEVARRETTSTDNVRVSGLQNGVTYDLEVYSLSEAKNRSAGNLTGQGTPQPVDDFWEFYRNQPGAHEQGGCGAGGAGPLALLGLAALLAPLRRRK